MFVRNLNIANQNVIDDLVKEERPSTLIHGKNKQLMMKLKQAVLNDLALVNAYGIQGAPALVIDKKYLISGAQPQELIEQAFKQAAQEANINITKPTTPQFQVLGDNTGASCRIENETWICD